MRTMPIRLVALHCQLNAKRLFFTSIRHSPRFGIATKVMRRQFLNASATCRAFTICQTALA